MKEFKIFIDNYDFYITAEVFESNKKMLSAINNFIRPVNKNEFIIRADAAWCGFPRNRIKEKLNKELGIYERHIGKIFLSKPYLKYSTISHECLHAAIDFCRNIVGLTWSIDNLSDVQEEFFVGIYTDIFEELLNNLFSKKYKIKVNLL
jgi:hypothetical protein